MKNCSKGARGLSV